MMYQEKIYEYLGYEYRIYEDREEDNIKLFHYCYKDGREIQMPNGFYQQSPYTLIDLDIFKEFVHTLEVFIQG